MDVFQSSVPIPCPVVVGDFSFSVDHVWQRVDWPNDLDRLDSHLFVFVLMWKSEECYSRRLNWDLVQVEWLMLS